LIADICHDILLLNSYFVIHSNINYAYQDTRYTSRVSSLYMYWIVLDWTRAIHSAWTVESL